MTRLRNGYAACLTACVAVVLLVGRILLFREGRLFGDQATLYASAVVSAGFTLALAHVVWVIAQHHPQSAGDTIATGAGLVGLIAGIFAATQLFLPSTPYQAAAPSCRGAPVAGSEFLAQTGPLGLNARSGPTTGLPQVNRYGPNCTLGFDGFCVGEPVADGRSQLLDVRWLIVHKRHELVASAETISQSPESALGATPSAQCTRYPSSRPLPKPVETFSPSLDAHGDVSLSARATGAPLIGYAIAIVDPADGSYPFSLLRVKSNNPDFTGVFVAGSVVPVLRHGTGSVVLAAESCLAADLPLGLPKAVVLTYVNGVIRRIAPFTAVDGRGPVKLLTATACAGPNGTNTGS
jgi:hypothetical protein